MQLTFRSLSEAEPGPKWQALFADAWPAFQRWFLSEGDEARPMPPQDWSHEIDRESVLDVFGDFSFDFYDLTALISEAEARKSVAITGAPCILLALAQPWLRIEYKLLCA